MTVPENDVSASAAQTEEKRILVHLVLEPRRFACLHLKLVDLTCEIRDQGRVLVKLGLSHGKIVFALLANIS